MGVEWQWRGKTRADKGGTYSEESNGVDSQLINVGVAHDCDWYGEDVMMGGEWLCMSEKEILDRKFVGGTKGV